MSFNPKVADFSAQHKDITMIGFFWSLYWRFYVVIFGVLVFVGIISALFE